MFRNPTARGTLMNLNWFEFVGKGAAATAPPEVTATATPATGHGAARRRVQRDGDRPRGRRPLTYAWDFGVPGTDADTSTQQGPTLHLRGTPAPTPPS